MTRSEKKTLLPKDLVRKRNFYQGDKVRNTKPFLAK